MPTLKLKCDNCDGVFTVIYNEELTEEYNEEEDDLDTRDWD